MKLVFLGTAKFALPSLRALAASRHQLEAVYTQPDRRKGRGLMVFSPPVKILAEELGIRVFQPEDISAPGALSQLGYWSPELLIVVAYGQILSSAVLEVPRRFAVNLHGSLLPEYRGAAPVNWAIINGETNTGVSIIRLNESMDAGDIISQKETAVGEDDNAITLGKKLAELGAGLLVKTLDLIEQDKVTFTPQDKEKASYARKLKKEDGLIRWNSPAKEIHNLVRGVLPWPGAYTFCRGKRLKIWKTEYLPELPGGMPGKIEAVGQGRVVVGCGKGILVLLEVQLEGGKRMGIEKFLRGHRLEPGEMMG